MNWDKSSAARGYGKLHRFGLWVAPGVFLWAEWRFEKAPGRAHWLMFPWACAWNDLVLWVRRGR